MDSRPEEEELSLIHYSGTVGGGNGSFKNVSRQQKAEEEQVFFCLLRFAVASQVCKQKLSAFLNI